ILQENAIYFTTRSYLTLTLSFGLTCFGIGYSIGKDSNKTQKREIMKAVKSCVQNQKDELMKILDVEE
ncbi:hypothetical protein, partial [uncultured Oscillibacter sp.]|uniref:hypothetical protein n=1 Tax=uncultured Oscillibacter sp. TaxID=876091 RepID=UPI0026151EE6